MKKKLFSCAAIVPAAAVLLCAATAAGVWGYSRRVVSIYPNTSTYKTENILLKGRIINYA